VCWALAAAAEAAPFQIMIFWAASQSDGFGEQNLTCYDLVV
jgi:hypothetical protein